ncbi:hypothetical protein C0Q70_20586 [Pomacea canaliculata]|uniref:Poly [ADP-ribose] polymerase n=1 Tax=Pomacea canaliculata TaxID=400727 RepID=A0A2T7NG31_POMCA|nr:hypothetical protein C0Q70_20586 [Pomacea canaliculata]
MEVRLAKFTADASQCIQSVQNDKSFSDFNLETNVLKFTYRSPQSGGTCKISMFASDDYPENSLITQLWEATGKEISCYCHVSVSSLLEKLGNDTALQVLEEQMKLDNQLPAVASALPDSGTVSSLGSSDSVMNSQSSSDLSDHSLDDFSEELYYFDDDSLETETRISETGESTLHPLLLRDMQMMRDLFSDTSISYRFLSYLGEVDVDMFLPLNFPNWTYQTSKAWRINLEEPLVIRINISSRSYLDSPDFPKIDVFQKSSSGETCGIARQVKSILQQFVHSKWKKLHNNSLQAATVRSHSVPTDLTTLSTCRVNQKAMCEASGIHRVQSGTSNSFFEERAAQDECNDHEKAPSLEYGFLVMLYQYARQRTSTLNEYCVVCDEPHIFQNGAMLKPAVCSRALCVFAYQTLGLMADAACDIATGAEVVDLLIALTKAACRSSRRAVIFEPFPDVVDPKNPKELVFSAKNKDYARLEQVLKKMPHMKELTMATAKDLQMKMDKVDILLFPLLTWIISSNRSHIVKLPSDKLITFMITPHQFLLLSSPPAKEVAFQAAKEKYGSTFAFHGSSIENWHSIIRNGLVVASNTPKQVNGAAHGKGIYLSPLSHLSFSYSLMGHGTHKLNKSQTEKQRVSMFATGIA